MLCSFGSLCSLSMDPCSFSFSYSSVCCHILINNPILLSASLQISKNTYVKLRNQSPPKSPDLCSEHCVWSFLYVVAWIPMSCVELSLDTSQPHLRLPKVLLRIDHLKMASWNSWMRFVYFIHWTFWYQNPADVFVCLCQLIIWFIDGRLWMVLRIT